MFAFESVRERLDQNRQSFRFAFHRLAESLPVQVISRSTRTNSYTRPAAAPPAATLVARSSVMPAWAKLMTWTSRLVLPQRPTAPTAVTSTTAAQLHHKFKRACKASSACFFKASLRPIKYGAVVIAAISVAAIATVHANQKLHEGDVAALRAQLRLKLAPPVLDGEGMFIGVRPPEINAFGLHLEQVGSGLAELPDACYEILTVLEDRNAGTFRYVGGVDYGGFFNGRRLAAGHGMSSLPMQLSSLITGAKTKQSKYARKSQEFANARTLINDLGGHRGMATAYASLAPYAVAGGEVRGLHNAAAAFFDTPVQSLTKSQCAVLMALPKLPLIVSGPAAGQAWLKVKTRAVFGLQKAYGGAAQADIELVNAMPIPSFSSSSTLAGATRQSVLPMSRALKAESIGVHVNSTNPQNTKEK